LRWGAQVTSWNSNVKGLRHNDRLSIGHCAYIFLVVAPATVVAEEKAAVAAARAGAASAGGDAGGGGKKKGFFGRKKKVAAGGVEEAPAADGAGGGEGGGGGGGEREKKVVTWDSAVREVVLRRPEGGQEYQVKQHKVPGETCTQQGLSWWLPCALEVTHAHTHTTLPDQNLAPCTAKSE